MARRYMNRRRQYFQPLHPPVFGGYWYGGEYGDYGDYGNNGDYGNYGYPRGDYTSGYSGGLQQSNGRQIQAFKRVLRLIEDFRAADSNQDGYINSQELEGIRGLTQMKLDMIVEAMQRKGNRIGIAEFLDLTADKLGGDDEFRKALQMVQTSSDGSSLRGEDLCEALLGRGVHLSLRETEEIVRAVDSFGVRAIRPQELELVVNALA